MKKRKLNLRKETVGPLSDDALSQVAGGSGNSGCTDCCDTLTCNNCINTEECNGSVNGCGDTIPGTMLCSRPPSACGGCHPTVAC